MTLKRNGSTEEGELESYETPLLESLEKATGWKVLTFQESEALVDDVSEYSHFAYHTLLIPRDIYSLIESDLPLLAEDFKGERKANRAWF